MLRWTNGSFYGWYTEGRWFDPRQVQLFFCIAKTVQKRTTPDKTRIGDAQAKQHSLQNRPSANEMSRRRSKCAFSAKFANPYAGCFCASTSVLIYSVSTVLTLIISVRNCAGPLSVSTLMRPKGINFGTTRLAIAA